MLTTIDGHTISLTDSHFIVVIPKGVKNVKIIPASDVTLEHQLVVAGQAMDLLKITYIERTLHSCFLSHKYTSYILQQHKPQSV